MDDVSTKRPFGILPELHCYTPKFFLLQAGILPVQEKYNKLPALGRPQKNCLYCRVGVSDNT